MLLCFSSNDVMLLEQRYQEEQESHDQLVRELQKQLDILEKEKTEQIQTVKQQVRNACNQNLQDWHLILITLHDWYLVV